ncbi:hypothetical protein WJX84_000177, partial [Apatococcus fuscideae]
RYYAGTLANCVAYTGSFLGLAYMFRGKNYKRWPRTEKLKSIGWRAFSSWLLWQETHRRGADRSITEWMATRTPMAGELMAILQEKDIKNSWTTSLPVDVLAHIPRLQASGSNEVSQGSSLESLEVGWAAARAGDASRPQAADNMAGLNSDPMFASSSSRSPGSIPSPSPSTVNDLGGSGKTWQDEAREVLGGSASRSTSGSERQAGRSWQQSRQEAFRRAVRGEDSPAEKQAAAEKAAAAAAAASSSSAASSSEWMDDSFMPADEAGFFGSSASEGAPEAHPRAHSRQSRWFRQRHAENRHSSRPEANPEADEAQDLSASERASRAGGTVFDSRWDQNKSGNGAAGKQRRHDRDTGGTQFDSRWDNPQP